MLTDALTVLTDQARISFGILALMLLSQTLVGAALKFLFEAQLTFTDRLTLGLSGWILPSALFSLLGWLIGFIPALAFFLLLALILFFARLKFTPQPDSAKIAFALLIFLLFSCLIRLASVARAILPSYFDSAQHYSLIKAILLGGTALPAGLPYYHTGYHALTAFIAATLEADIAQTMLILGQIVLAVMPLSIFFLVRYITQSTLAAFLAVTLSALGWYMPAHAVNWGKYPALLSLALLPFGLNLASLTVKNHKDLPLSKRMFVYGLLALAVFVNVWLHTRALIILVMAFAAWALAMGWQRLPRGWRVVLVFVALAILTLQVVGLQKQALFALVLDPYSVKGIWITLPVLFLSLFAWRNYSQLLFACLVFVSLLLGALFLPFQIPGYGPLTLLDRPLVEMILYLPLAFLGGLGWAGLEKKLSQTSFRGISSQGILFVLISGLIIVHAFAKYNFYPSDCCVLASPDDMTAITWMDAHLPTEARIGIAVTEMNVVPTEQLEGYAGGDAGIWINPLINRVAFPVVYGSDFGQEMVWQALCQAQVSHLFVGGAGQSFDSRRLQSRPEWYRVLLSISSTGVYEVVGCK